MLRENVNKRESCQVNTKGKGFFTHSLYTEILR